MPRLPFPLLLLVLTTPLAGAGCLMTKSEGETLRRDIDQLKKELAADIQRARAESKKLQKIMEQATDLLTRNSADVGAQVERMQQKMAKLSGTSEESEQAIKDLQQKLDDFRAKVDVKLEGLSGQSAVSRGSPVPEDKEELFKAAESRLNANDHQEARRLLRHFIERNPSDARMDQAQLMLGDSYFAEQKYAQAIVEYKKIIEQHKNSPSVPDALYKIGMSFYQLKFCSDADLFLSQLLKRSPRHPQAARAKKVLNLVKRYRKNRNLCRP